MSFPQVSSDVTFPDLDLETLQTDAAFKAQFEDEFVTAMAAAADVAKWQVEILGYSSGSVVVNSVIVFSPDDAAEVQKAEAMVTQMATAPAAIFQASDLLSSYGEVSVALPPPPPPSPSPPPPSPQETDGPSTATSPPPPRDNTILTQSRDSGSSAVRESTLVMVVALVMLALAM